VVLLTACGPQLTAEPTESPMPTAVPTRPPYDPAALITVERRDLLDSVTGRATVVPELTDQLFFRRAGRIGSVEVAAGDEVKQGQVLAQLEQTDLEYQIGLARIDIEVMQLRARHAREQEASTLEIAIAEKEVERAGLALKRLETEQQSLLVLAPYAGRVTELDATAGAEVDAYQPIGTIVGTEQLMILAEFSGPKAGRVGQGQVLELSEFLDEQVSFEGTVTGTAGAGSPRPLTVEPAAGAPELELGDLFRATAVLGRAGNVVTLPTSAIRTIGDRRYVLLVEQGELQRVYVETGIETDGIIEITAGLREGQQVSER